MTSVSRNATSRASLSTGVATSAQVDRVDAQAPVGVRHEPAREHLGGVAVEAAAQGHRDTDHDGEHGDDDPDPVGLRRPGRRR